MRRLFIVMLPVFLLGAVPILGHFEMLAAMTPDTVGNPGIPDLVSDRHCERFIVSYTQNGARAESYLVTRNTKVAKPLRNDAGKRLNYASFASDGTILAAEGGDIYRLNDNGVVEKTLLSLENKVFYPVEWNGLIIFSMPTIIAKDGKNPYQRRILLASGLDNKDLHEFLNGWMAFSIGRPYFTDKSGLYIDLIMPERRESTTEEYLTSGLIESLNDVYSFRFRISNGGIDKVSYSGLLENSLSNLRQRYLEQISVTDDEKYVVFYHYEGGTMRWIVNRRDAAPPIASFPSNGRDRVVIDPGGQCFIHAQPSASGVLVSIYNIESGSLQDRFTINLS